MNKETESNIDVKTDQYVMVGIAVLVLVFAFADLFFDALSLLFPNIKLISLSVCIPKITLFVLGYLFISIAIERRKRLDYIQATLDAIVNNYSLGAQYLENREAVNEALGRAVRQADETIMAMGSRSTAVKYLKGIQEAVVDRKVRYYRLIEGPEITHELCEHLKALVESESTQIIWTPKEKFGNLTVTEQPVGKVKRGKIDALYTGS
jgi:hypothetical protein